MMSRTLLNITFLSFLSSMRSALMRAAFDKSRGSPFFGGDLVGTDGWDGQISTSGRSGRGKTSKGLLARTDGTDGGCGSADGRGGRGKTLNGMLCCTTATDARSGSRDGRGGRGKTLKGMLLCRYQPDGKCPSETGGASADCGVLSESARRGTGR